MGDPLDYRMVFPPSVLFGRQQLVVFLEAAAKVNKKEMKIDQLRFMIIERSKGNKVASTLAAWLRPFLYTCLGVVER